MSCTIRHPLEHKCHPGPSQTSRIGSNGRLDSASHEVALAAGSVVTAPLSELPAIGKELALVART